jgi:hypothetical protein
MVVAKHFGGVFHGNKASLLQDERVLEVEGIM